MKTRAGATKTEKNFRGHKEDNHVPVSQRNQKRIRNGELIDHYLTDNYPGIGEALVLVFKTAPVLRPIRPHRFLEYFNILQSI